MALTQECATSNIPMTIFDETDGSDLDVSDEMEEIRELLYELIKTNFASGVMVEHLAKIYRESYETRGLGPSLPENWLNHIRVAEEFEVVNRGPIMMVYTRQRDTSPFVIENPPKNTLNITKSVPPLTAPSPLPTKEPPHRIRLSDNEMAQQMKSILSFEPIICPATVSVIVVRCETDRTDIHVQLAGTRNNFELLLSAMDGHYEEQGLGEVVTVPEFGGVYAVRDSDGHWYRAIVKAADTFNLVDVGRTLPAEGTTARRLRAEYALPRIYPIYAFIVTLDKECDSTSTMCIMRTACQTQLPLPLRFMSEYFENGSTKFAVQSASIWIKDMKEHEQNVIRVMPVAPQYASQSRGIELVPMDISEMPTKPFAANVLAVFDAGNISIRQCSLDPIPDYIKTAVRRDALTQSAPPPFSELIPGRFYAARLHQDSTWERVQLLGTSAVDADCFRVYTVDVGMYGVVRKPNIRHLKLPVGLRKILMAKCKIAGVRPRGGGSLWTREGQAAVCNVLLAARKVEVVPVGEWKLIGEPGCVVVPFNIVNIIADGVDVGELLISQGYAKRL